MEYWGVFRDYDRLSMNDKLGNASVDLAEVAAVGALDFTATLSSSQGTIEGRATWLENESFQGADGGFDEVLAHGALHMRRWKAAKWQLRWFELTQHDLLYYSSQEDAIELMRKTAADLHRDPFMRGLIRSHLEMQGIHEFDNGSPILRMRLRTAPEYQWDVSRAFNLALKRRMEAEYINIGAPRMSVSMEAAGGARFDKRGKPSDTESTPTNLDWPTDNAPSPDGG